MIEDAPDRDDRDTFIELFARHDRQLRAYIGTLLPNPADSDDVFQRTSLVLWQKFDRFRRDENFLSWACGVAFYEVRNFRRVQSRGRLLFDDDLLRILADRRRDDMERSDRRRGFLEGCLRRLGDDERWLVQACYGAEKTIRQIAAGLGQSADAVYGRLKRIRRKLVECTERRMAAAKTS